MDLISLQGCDGYDENLLRERLVALLQPLGGIERFVRQIGRASCRERV